MKLTEAPEATGRWDLPSIPRDEVLGRIMPKLDRSGDCWIWQAGKNGWGYGQAEFGGRPFTIHRLMYSLHVGPIQPGQVVRHRCDNPPCVNPDHLLTGTNHDNVRDREERGRGVTPRITGLENWNARHDAAFIKGVVDEYATGLYSQATLARRYGVSQSTVNNWVNRRYRPDAIALMEAAS